MTYLERCREYHERYWQRWEMEYLNKDLKYRAWEKRCEEYRARGQGWVLLIKPRCRKVPPLPDEELQFDHPMPQDDWTPC